MADDFWQSFQVIAEEEESGPLSMVSKDILEIFGIPYTNFIGGTLAGVDIKRADALSVLKASLLELYAQSETSGLFEMCINADGKAYFYEVGKDTSYLNPYYSIPSVTSIKPNVAVIITGGKPRQERLVDAAWYSLIGEGATAYTVFDTTRLTTSCLSDNFSSNAIVTYYDPIRHKANPSWNDGIEDMIELGPFDRFMGFTWRVTPPSDLVTSTTKIYKQSQSSIPLLLAGGDYRIGGESCPYIGTLRKRTPRYSSNAQSAECLQYDGIDSYCTADMLTIDLADKMQEGLTYDTIRGTFVSKFLSIQNVYVVGTALVECYGIAKPGRQKFENNEENSVLFIGTSVPYSALYRLNEGVHYTTHYPDDTGEPSMGVPCIQFANNLRYYDNAKVGTGVSFYINTHCVDFARLFGAADSFVGTGTVLPLENGQGLLVEQVWAQLNLDAPCFVVVDPQGKAEAIAQGLTVEILPLVFRDLPSPIAINGQLINQEDSQQDNDPTTQQDLQNTALETAYNSLGSGRTISMNFASLSEGDTERLSRKLYAILQEDMGKIYTHTCPPTDTPILGNEGLYGGIINVIEYSYTDQGSYLITVTEGPVCFGDFSGIDGGVYYKGTEEVTVQGTIIEDAGNHVQYKVHVDGIGPIHCINGCAQVLAVRDRVSIAIHNNAVES